MDHNKVLIVDDDESIRLMVQAKLAAAGITSDLAGNVEDAASEMRQHLYSVVVLDIHLPGTCGRMPGSGCR